MRGLMKLGGALAVALSLAGCVTVSSYTMNTPYDAAAQAIVQNGNNAISGNALLRTVGGEVRSCAGIEMKLIKATAYASERMTAEFGGTESTFRAMGDNITSFRPENLDYESAALRATCDSQGNFEFNDLPDGTYYIRTYLSWRVPSQFGMVPTGGTLMARVSLSGGERERVVMAY